MNLNGYDIELCVMSQPRYLCVVRAAVAAAIERYGFSEAQCARVMLAVDEAVTNVMRHGYAGAENQPIWVKVKPTDLNDHEGFTIVVEDRARQVDPNKIRGRDLEDVRPGGLGVHIIREVMDQVEYSKREDGGMRLVMAKAADHNSTQANQQESSAK